MNYRKILACIVAAVLIVMAVVCAQKLVTFEENVFNVPEGAKAALVLSSGRGEKERSVIYYYDSKGANIGKNTFSSAACKYAIEGNNVYDDINFFTHEAIYFSDGTVLENKEMEEKYSFASEDGEDCVYESGYVDSWNMYYKNISHGLAYDISELGAFDLLVIYDKAKATNIRINETSTIAVNQKDGAIYGFVEDQENPSMLLYEKITYGGNRFNKDTGTIDLSGAGSSTEEVWGVKSAIWSDDDLYITTNQGEGEHSFLSVYHIKKEGNNYAFIDSVDFNPGEFALNKHYDMPPHTLSNYAKGIVSLYVDYSEYWYPGIIMFNTENRKYDFNEYKGNIINAESSYKRIGSKVYSLDNEYDNQECLVIYEVRSGGKTKERLRIATPDDNLFIADFYYFDKKQ